MIPITDMIYKLNILCNLCLSSIFLIIHLIMQFKSISFILIVFMCIGCSTKIPTALKNGWQPLLIDEQMSSFEILNGNADYYVEGETIIGVSKSNTPNTFLCTKQKYGDFILEFEVWADPLLNSGVQFRSISDPEVMDGRVHGYQVEIESSPRKWAGGIYDEGRRGWLYSLDSNPKARDAFRVGQWNHYRVQAIGNLIVTWVNKVQCTHLIDDLTSEGFIGLQVHSIENEDQENKLVKWRKLRIKTSDLEKEKWPLSTDVTLVKKTNSK